MLVYKRPYLDIFFVTLFSQTGKKLLLRNLAIKICLIETSNKLAAFCNPLWDFIKTDKF